MRRSDRAPLAAFSVLAAVAGTASVGIAVLAHQGVCVHHLLRQPMPAATMPGMPMDPAAPTAGPCPILVAAAIVAAALYVLAAIALAASRPSTREVAVASARIVLAVRFHRLAAGLAVAGSIPLMAAIVADVGFQGAVLTIAAASAVAAALLAAAVLGYAARAILAFAHRLVDAIVAAFALLPPGAEAPWPHEPCRTLVAAGVRLARRRPSRAPPLRA